MGGHSTCRPSAVLTRTPCCSRAARARSAHRLLRALPTACPTYRVPPHRVSRHHATAPRRQVFAAMNAPYLCRSYDAPVVTFSHFLPRPELMPPRFNVGAMSFLADAAGSHLIEAQLRALGSRLHVFGHTHVNWDCEVTPNPSPSPGPGPSPSPNSNPNPNSTPNSCPSPNPNLGLQGGGDALHTERGALPEGARPVEVARRSGLRGPDLTLPQPMNPNSNPDPNPNPNPNPNPSPSPNPNPNPNLTLTLTQP